MSIGFYSFGEGELDAAAVDIAVIGALTGHRWGRAVPFLHIQDKEHSCFLTTKQECSFIIRPKQGTVPVLNRNLREGKKEHV